MASKQNNTSWTSTQVYVMSAICLLLGIAVGYLVRGPGQPVQAAPATMAQETAPAQQAPTPEQLKHMADTKAEPLLAQLKSKPNDAQLLAEIGNIYYDTQTYPDAISYYKKALDVRDDANVRTDMATAYYYAGDPDTALAEFSRTLKTNPNFENALFNTGMVKFQAKLDFDGAVAAWEQMLKANPSTPRRAEVEQMIARARQHAGLKPGQKATSPAM
jgi:cytochrome c-type biogenesis protein CcmH/NrfG